jgi:hypothetical protein
MTAFAVVGFVVLALVFIAGMAWLRTNVRIDISTPEVQNEAPVDSKPFEPTK